MGAFKQFNSQDVIVSPLEISKGYRSVIQPVISRSGGYGFISYGTGSYSGTATVIDAFGFGNFLDRLYGKNVPFNITESTSGIQKAFKESSVYNSVKQLYYSNYLSGSVDSQGEFLISPVNRPDYREDGVITGSKYNTIYDNFRQTDLNEGKFFPTASNSEIAVLTIPQKLYGDMIQPGSFKLTYGAFSASEAGTITDDGQGRLISQSVESVRGSDVVGNIIYSHGIVIITNDEIAGGTGGGFGYEDYGDGVYGAISTSSLDFFRGFVSGSDMTASFSSSYTLYETQYKCTIGESEFNYTQNPSATTGSDGTPYSYITSSYFSPYVTTVGLYNNSYELLAVAKLAKPLPTSKFSDTTILVNFDRQ